MRILLLSLLLSLVACNTDNDPFAAIPAGTKGYFIFMERGDIKESFSRTNNTLNHRQVSGFALGGGTDDCRIFVPPIDGDTDYEAIQTLLHEIRHCAYGNYHL